MPNRWGALFLALAWVGYFAPWAPHHVAALSLSGFDLAEWATFLPGVRDGSLSFGRLHFLAPLAALAVLSPIVALGAFSNTERLRRAFAFGAALTGLVGAAAIFPPYPLTLSAASDPELRPQLLLGLLALGGWLVGLSVRRWPSAAAGLAQSAVALVGLAFAAWAFAAARPIVAELYNAPVGVGWGWMAALLGFAGLAFRPGVVRVGQSLLCRASHR